MNGWMLLVTGPDSETGQTPRKRLIAVTAENSDEAFEAARDAMPGGMLESVGPLTESTVADLRLVPGKSRVLGIY
jgi:hypothetical protein